MNEVRVEVHFFVYRYLTSSKQCFNYIPQIGILCTTIQFEVFSNFSCNVVFGYGLFRSILLTNIWWCFRYIVTDF